jgi:hypothetical protein
MQEFDRVLFLLEIIQKSDQSLQSNHHPLSERDVQILQSWPSGGLVQVAHALTLEALRREASTMILAMLSGGREAKDISAAELQERLIGRMLEFTNTFGLEVCQKTLEPFQK